MMGISDAWQLLFLIVGGVFVLNWIRCGRSWRLRQADWWEARRAQKPESDPADRAALEACQDSVQQLETRVAELENRLDFAERLLTERSADQRLGGAAV